MAFPALSQSKSGIRRGLVQLGVNWSLGMALFLASRAAAAGIQPVADPLLSA